MYVSPQTGEASIRSGSSQFAYRQTSGLATKVRDVDASEPCLGFTTRVADKTGSTSEVKSTVLLGVINTARKAFSSAISCAQQTERESLNSKQIWPINLLLRWETVAVMLWMMEPLTVIKKTPLMLGLILFHQIWGKGLESVNEDDLRSGLMILAHR